MESYVQPFTKEQTDQFARSQALLTHNGKVYIVGRSREKIEEAIEELAKETGKHAHLLQVDLSDLKTIKPAVEEFQSYVVKICILFFGELTVLPYLQSRDRATCPVQQRWRHESSCRAHNRRWIRPSVRNQCFRYDHLGYYRQTLTRAAMYRALLPHEAPHANAAVNCRLELLRKGSRHQHIFYGPSLCVEG